MKGKNAMKQFVYGINPVLHSIDTKQTLKIYLLDNFKNKEVVQIIKKNNIETELITKERMNLLVPGAKTMQGICAEVKPFRTYDLNEFLSSIKTKEKSVILILDNLEDPHNLGAILRICDAFKVDGIIIKNANQTQLTPLVAKISTGAIFYVKVCIVSNLNNAISTLKSRGFWIYAADGNGDMNYYDVEYPNKTALVIGSEGFGISNLVLKNSDIIVKIPMGGNVNSLNASNAASVILSQIYRNLL